MSDAAPEILRFTFPEAGSFPNNPRLPVVIYKKAFSDVSGNALADAIETRWKQNSWAPAWRWGVYDFPHYHSTAHEILGVFRGEATLRLGHTSGVTVVAQPGDILVLPAGTVHQNLGSSSDFQVVGGYPPKQEADLMRGNPGERPGADQRIAKVPLPSTDPVSGASGALIELWKIGT